MTEAAIERRRDQAGGALDKVFGTGNARQALAVVEQNVRDIVDVARERGFVTTFERDGKVTEFYGFAAWHLLAMTYGIASRVESVEPVEGGWLAKAVAEAQSGATWSAFAMCTRKEPRRGGATDHTLLAMAQTRAMRNALRSALASALVLAGFEFADPNAPATTEQVGLLHKLARDSFGSEQTAKAELGIDHFSDLTREEASETIDALERVLDNNRYAAPQESAPGEAPATGTGEGAEEPAGGVHGSRSTAGAGGAGAGGEGSPPPAPLDEHAGERALPELWAEAAGIGLTAGRAIQRARQRFREGDAVFPEAVPRSSDLTTRQLRALVDERRKGRGDG